MTLTINLGLLLIGALATLTAFGGETWKRGDEPLSRRVTARGWLALSCMGLSLLLGSTKEIRSHRSAADSEQRQRALERGLQNAATDLNAERQNLERANAELNAARSSLADVAKKLADTRAKLAAIEPNVLQGILVATSGMRRESDFATVVLDGNESAFVASGRTGAVLSLYGGDLIDYHIFCSDGRIRSAAPFLRAQGAAGPTGISLQIGDTRYPLSLRDNGMGRFMVIGPVGRAMDTRLYNSGLLEACHLKLLVESADRTREARLLEPLIDMIKDARDSQIEH